MKKEEKKTTKSVSKEVKTMTEKELVKTTDTAKEEKVSKKGTKVKKDKKENKRKGNVFSKIADYFKSVHLEMKKVRWPNKKEMLLYSGATLSFIIIFALFFMLNDVVISAVKQLVR